MDQGVKLITAASRAFELARREGMSHEQVLKVVSQEVRAERDERVKIGMVAAASKSLNIIDKNPTYNERQVLREVMDALPSIQETINEEIDVER